MALFQSKLHPWPLKEKPRTLLWKLQKTAYIALVRSRLEYISVVWDPYFQKDIDSIKKVQKKASRFISGDFRSRNPGDMSKILSSLQLVSLQSRRKEKRLRFFAKIVNGNIPSLPPDKYLAKMDKEKRKIRPTRLDQYSHQNIVQNSLNVNPNSYRRIYTKSMQRRNSFFPRTIIDWNLLNESQSALLQDAIQGPGGVISA